MSRKWVWKGAEYVLNEKAANKIFDNTTEKRQATLFDGVRWLIQPTAQKATFKRKKN